MISVNKGKPILLIALGGNALIQKNQVGTIEEQFQNLKRPIQQIARLCESHNVIITHGNGPQVGNLLLQQECCREVPELPLEILVAQTQGQIGYMIESALDEELMAMNVYSHPLSTLITYVVVDRKDPAFISPSKPIGPVFTREQAERAPYPTLSTPKGFRRVVASPRPITIVEKREIEKLIEMNFIVICCGGGGIPVIREGRAFSGVNAVIDKDLVSALLAEEVGVDIFVIATDTEGVMRNFATPEQELIRVLQTGEADRLVKQNHLGRGSMQPKVEAAARFVQRTGKRAVITSTGKITDAVFKKGGTEILKITKGHS